MIPVTLKWQRPVDGVEIIEGKPETILGRTGTEIFVVRRDARREAGFEDYELKLTDLEDPIALKFLNAKADGKLVDFLSRYGMLKPFNAPMHLVEVEHEAEMLAMSLVYSTNREFSETEQPVGQSHTGARRFAGVVRPGT